MTTRAPTASELRAADALLREVAMDAGSPPIKNAFAMLSARSQVKVLNQVRAVIRSLKELDDDMMRAGLIAIGRNNLRDAFTAIIDTVSPEVK